MIGMFQHNIGKNSAEIIMLFHMVMLTLQFFVVYSFWKFVGLNNFMLYKILDYQNQFQNGIQSEPGL